MWEEGGEKVHQSFILLQTIKDVDLQALESLEYINLSRNLIREIMPGTFLGMPNLLGLDFSVNAVIKVNMRCNYCLESISSFTFDWISLTLSLALPMPYCDKNSNLSWVKNRNFWTILSLTRSNPSKCSNCHSNVKSLNLRNAGIWNDITFGHSVRLMNSYLLYDDSICMYVQSNKHFHLFYLRSKMMPLKAFKVWSTWTSATTKCYRCLPQL